MSSSLLYKQAWLHTMPECSPETYQHTYHDIMYRIFYSDFVVDNPSSVPLGFADLLARLKPHSIPQQQIAYFYNRQTIVQMFWRFSNKEKPVHVPLQRPFQPFTEIQFDSFFISNAQNYRQNLQKDLDQNGVPITNTPKSYRILVGVDVSSRFLLGVEKIQYDGNNRNDMQKKTASAAIGMIMPYMQTIQLIRTDDGNEYGETFQKMLQDAGYKGAFDKINKMGHLMDHPGRLAPAETAVRSVRELFEKYRVLSKTSAFQPQNFKNIFKSITHAFNFTKHSAFKHTLSPADYVHNPSGMQTWYEKQNQERTNTIQSITQNPLQIGEIVRLVRTQNAFDKQSYPTLTASLYRVTNIQGSFVNVSVIALPANGFHGSVDLSHSEHDFPRGGHDQNIPIHHNRIARIKSNQLWDPPLESGFLRHLRSIQNDEDPTGTSKKRKVIYFQKEEILNPAAIPPSPDKSVHVTITPPTEPELRRSKRIALRNAKSID